MSAQLQLDRSVNPNEYLARERQADIKSEYLDGDVVAMPGSSREHNLIVGNLVGLLWQQLRGRPEVVYPSDLRVWIPGRSQYTYPDVTVVRGESRFQDDHFDSLVNPTAIIEVLSPGTESYDRGDKFAAYRSIPSLEEYLLVSQFECRVERFERRELGSWQASEYLDLSGVVRLSSVVDCQLPLAEIYGKVPAVS